MKRLLATSLAAAVVLSACGVAEDTVAATVAGRDISTDAVAELAESTYIAAEASAQGGLVANLEGSTGVQRQRFALRYLVMTAVLERLLEDRGGEITPDDLQQASEGIAQEQQQAAASGMGAPEIDTAARQALTRFRAAQTALSRSIEVTPEEIQDYFDEHSDEFGDLTCIDGFAVLSESGPAAQALLDGGAGIEDIAGNAELAAQPLTQTGEEVCVLEGDITSPDLAPLANGPVGEWGSTVLTANDGSELAVFILPSSRRPATPNDDAVLQRIEQELSATIQERVERELDLVAVDVDPRFGRWDSSDQERILPPRSPQLSARALELGTFPQA